MDFTPHGISGNNIVGEYSDSSGIHGFLYDGSTYKTLNVPGANATVCEGIDSGNIVGYYSQLQGSTDYYHGFLYDGSTYKTLDYPLATSTFATGISGNRVVGSSDVSNFIYDGSNYAAFAPGSPAGISGDNIVGDLGLVSFFYDGSSYTYFHIPGAFDMHANSVDGSTIVGYYRVLDGRHGFVGDVSDFAPEPSTLILLSIGASAFIGLHWRRRAK